MLNNMQDDSYMHVLYLFFALGLKYCFSYPKFAALYIACLRI